MRIRTMLALTAGAAAGAGAMYLFDPDQGSGRRRDVAVRTARSGRARLAGGPRGLGRRVGERARHYTTSARAGFDEAVASGNSRGR